MAEEEVSSLEHQVKRLRLTVDFMLLMIILLVIMLVYNDLLLYSRILDRPLEIALFSNFTFIFAVFTLLCFFAVIVAAISRS